MFDLTTYSIAIVVYCCTILAAIASASFGKITFYHGIHLLRLPAALTLLSVYALKHPYLEWRTFADEIAIAASAIAVTILLFALLANTRRAGPCTHAPQVVLSPMSPSVVRDIPDAPLEPTKTVVLTRDRSKELSPPQIVRPRDIYRHRHFINVMGEINRFEAEQFTGACQRAIHEGIGSITVQVHTPGGDLDSGWNMREQLRLLAMVADVNVLVMGTCKSAGVSFITGVPVSHRWATSDSEFMIHGARHMNNNGPILTATLTPTDKERLDICNTRWVINVLTEHTAISPADLDELIVNEQDFYFTAVQALELGVIGGII